MEDQLPNPGRRLLLQAAVVPGFDRLLGPLVPRMGSYEEWFASIRNNDTRRMEALLARGFDPNSIEPQLFDTSLIVAIRHKSAKVIALLLSIDNLKIDAQSRNGDTALMIACWLSDTSTALALIDKGAEINRPGWTPLHYAAASGNVTIIRRLLDESAYIDAESPNGSTPLMMAARAGRRDALQLLLDEGADLMLRNERGMTAADFARSHGFPELARLLDERTPATGRPESAPTPPASEAGAGSPTDGAGSLSQDPNALRPAPEPAYPQNGDSSQSRTPAQIDGVLPAQSAPAAPPHQYVPVPGAPAPL